MLGWLPEDVSPYGAGIDALFYFIYYLTAAAFIVVTALMLIFLYVYRDRGGRRAAYTHGNTAMEIIWTIIPAMIFIALGLVSRSLWEEIKLEPPETDTVVKVTGKQFNWEILYPGPDGEFDTEDDKQIDNDIRVPAGKPIRVILASKDVIHSFFMPNLRFKQDMVPGREIIGWFQANKPGKYEIPCAELCGFGHSGMKGWLYALAPEEYQAWRSEQWPQEAASNGAAASNGQTETSSIKERAPVPTVTTASEPGGAGGTVAAGAATLGEASQASQIVAGAVQEATTEAATAATQVSESAVSGVEKTAADAAEAHEAAATFQSANEAADAVQEALPTSTKATRAATQTVVIAATSAITDPAVPMPETEMSKTQSLQEASAEQSSSEATSETSGKDSAADISLRQYAFTPTTIDQSGTEPCKGQLEILSGATIYEIAGESYPEEKRFLGVDLILDYNTHIKNPDNIYPGQKLCTPRLTQTARLLPEQERGFFNLILDAFRSSRKAKALAQSAQQKDYRASVVPRRVSNSLLSRGVEIAELQDQTTADQVRKLFNSDDLS